MDFIVDGLVLLVKPTAHHWGSYAGFIRGVDRLDILALLNFILFPNLT
jgi:hypothetical protein